MYLFNHCLINYLDPIFIYIRVHVGVLGIQVHDGVLSVDSHTLISPATICQCIQSFK